MVGGAHDQPVPVIPVTVMPAGMFSVMVMAPAGNVIGGPHRPVIGSRTSGGLHSCFGGTHRPVTGSRTSGGLHSCGGAIVTMRTHSLPRSTVPGGHPHTPVCGLRTIGGGQASTHLPSFSTPPFGHTQVGVQALRQFGPTQPIGVTIGMTAGTGAAEAAGAAQGVVLS